MIDFDMGPDLRIAQPEVPVDHAVLAHVLGMIHDESIEPWSRGWALEFGVATGTTLAMIAKVLPVIGFDSFNGLPEDWRDGFKRGMFRDVRPAGEIPNATIVEGLFSDTLPGYDWPDHVALIHLDADLYSSTREALIATAGCIQDGTYLVFDEFFGYDESHLHEQRAFAEFVEETGLTYAVVGHGREQWAVRALGGVQ